LTIDGTLKDGDTIAHGSTTEVVSSGLVYVQVTISELESIDVLLNAIVTNTSPRTTSGAISHPDISANIVGVTIENVGAGTTLTLQIVAIGF
jgi:hypothetical protein